jgi:hypothetical protein
MLAEAEGHWSEPILLSWSRFLRATVQSGAAISGISDLFHVQPCIIIILSDIANLKVVLQGRSFVLSFQYF